MAKENKKLDSETKLKMKIVFNNGPLYIECEVENEEQRKDAIKGIKYAYDDLSACFGVANINNQPAPERVESVPLASDRQIAYMRERGIPTWDNMTKYEAIDEINKWKEANNIPVSENAKYYKK